MSIHDPIPGTPHICPWWLIHTFDNPVRRLFHDPEKILRDFVRPGDNCLDLGCGFGYFTIPLARLVGATGSVTAVDVQSQMLVGVRRRAERSGLSPRIRLHQADTAGLHLEGTFDFALAFWMAHEVPEQSSLFQEILAALKPRGKMLLVEPKGHVTRDAFVRTLAIAENAGFLRTIDAHVAFSRGILLAKSDITAAPQRDQASVAG